jgi:hypothetical protein
VTIIVTVHAAQRYRDRIDPSASLRQARAELRSHSRALDAAASMSMGATVIVRLASGAQFVVEDGNLVTVLSAEQHAWGVRHV